jgi:hypothetical protein
LDQPGTAMQTRLKVALHSDLSHKKLRD